MQSENSPQPGAKTEGAPKADTANASVVAKLEAAAQDLLFVSETDAPLTPFFWPSDTKELTPELLAQFAKLPGKNKIGTQTLAEFFRPVATEEDWMNADEKAEVAQFQELAKVLEANLSNIVVYRAGETNIDVFVVGKAEGGFAGVATKVVET